MLNDRLLKISVGSSRNSLNWQLTEILWSDFIRRVKVPIRSQETFDEYIRMQKAQQGILKDIGGFVGGTLNGLRRKAEAVTGRDLVTLDFDNIPSGGTDAVLKRVSSLGIAYCIYSTRSHAPYRPRLRIIIPLDKTVTPDEYEPVARKLAAVIGIEYCDPTTFEASRLMYWPGCSKDSEYVFQFEDKPFASADGILAQYDDWRDMTAWPQVPGAAPRAKVLLARQSDPTKKEGLIGAFCRVYDIRGALLKYLPNAYEDVEGKSDRMTYTGGTTTAGAVLYEDGKFLYSHHATDPCCDQLVNAFDLVRIHLFHELDVDIKPHTGGNARPSFKAMRKLAMEDEVVLRELNLEKAQQTMSVFTDLKNEDNQVKTEDNQLEIGEKPTETVLNVDWMREAKLDYNPDTGNPKKTMDNILRILRFDPLLKGKIAIDDFSNQGMALGELPWNACPDKRLWTDTDDAGLLWWLEYRYDITGRDKALAAVMLVSNQQKYNEVKDYLEALVWDGTERLDRVFIDYLAAEDTPYTRAVARKSFTAAVARVMRPGCKYDYVPVFNGPQGIGKTTFLKTIGKNWYSDSLQNFNGKEASEMIQGIWINEIGEMSGYNRSEMDIVKQFLSRCDDVYRQPYGKHAVRFPRKGVFFGTCNNHDFLKDPTGNRRFWPVDVGLHKPVKNIWAQLPEEVDQLWAEAVVRYAEGEQLFMDTPELDAATREAQEAHRENSIREGMIRDWIEKPVPPNYTSLSLSARRIFWNGGMAGTGDLVPREKVCAAEVWCELFMGDPKHMRRSDANEINQVLVESPGWRRNVTSRRFGYAGKQKGFERVMNIGV